MTLLVGVKCRVTRGLLHAGVRRDRQPCVVEAPVVVGVGGDVGPFVGIGPQVEEVLEKGFHT